MDTQLLPWQGRCDHCPTSDVYRPDISKGCGKGGGFETQEDLVVRLLADANGFMLRGGTFLEMGAVDGLQLTNTHFLESCLGWRGVLIEANPSLELSLCRNRPRALSFNMGVCSPPNTTMPFEVPPGHWTTGGNPATRAITKWGPRTGYLRRREVPCAPLHTLLRHARVTHLDYFSLE